MVENELIKGLADLDTSMRPLAGGKGTTLGELARTDLPVPPGFVITTVGYRRFVEANQLQARLVALATARGEVGPAAHESVAAQIQALFAAGAFPSELADAIRTAYAELAGASAAAPAVAVRSSATAEDLPSASFAGQQATFLNVRGAAALLEAVRACWASLWTARALAYRARQGIGPEGIAMAVVVQVMVPAEVSGILFTANPTTGARNELVVDASFGLGEAIVSGAVTPDRYVLDRARRTVTARTLGTKAVMHVPAAGTSVTTQPVPETRRDEWALSEAQLGELVELGVAVEAHFGGAPQDIEWAVADGRLWLLQARPITALPPPPLRDVRWVPPRPNSVWMRRQVVEHMPDPLSPLFAELYVEEGLDHSLRAMAEYMSDLVHIKIDMDDFFEPPFATTINGYAYSVAGFNFSWRLVPNILRLYIVALPKMIRYLVPYWRDEALPAYRATIAHWKQVDLAATSDETLLQGVRALAMADAIYWFAAAVPLGLARVTDGALDRFLQAVSEGGPGTNGPRPTSGPYLRGFPSKTVEAQARLEAIARDIRRSEDLRVQVGATPAARLLDLLATHPEGPPVRDALQQYLDDYGHQIYDLDFVAPTLADAPLPVLLSLQAAVAQPERDARAQQAKLAGEREALVADTDRALNPVQRRLFRRLLDWAQHYGPYREEALFYVGAAWPALRRLALELGRRLTAAGSLDAPDHVFFLRTTELAEASAARAAGAARPDLAQLARERQALRDARKRLDPPLSVPPNAQLKFGPLRLTMFEPQPSSASTGPTLQGFAVSPGQVTAAASVIRSPEEFAQMAPDTVLVCPTTTPAWTPLFAQAKGLVTDIGGTLAHGSIVAREYGIPAVMGTGTATSRIQSGQRIRVDGDSGTVTLLDEGEAAGAPSTEAQRTEVAPPGRSRALLALAAVAVALGVWWRARR